MSSNSYIGIDANEANLVTNRVGSNQFAYGLLKTIENIDKKNDYFVYFSTSVKDDMPKERKGWHYRVIPPHKLWTQWRLPLDLYLHQPRPKVFLSLSHYVPRFSPVPRIVTITDLGYLKYPEQLLKKDLLQLKLWTAHSIKVADHIIAISEFTKNDILENYPIDPQKISIVYPGFDDTVFNPSVKKRNADKVLQKYGIDAPYILFLGALKPNKNLEMLIKGFNGVRDKNLKLVIAGKKGWLYESIFNVVRTKKMQNKVIFTDFVPDEDVPLLISHAQAFALPSLYEGFGMPVVESMACGVPVLVSDRGSLPEVVGDAGVIVDPLDEQSIASGIHTVLKNNLSLSKKALSRANKFTWKQSGRNTVEILNRYL